MGMLVIFCFVLMMCAETFTGSTVDEPKGGILPSKEFVHALTLNNDLELFRVFCNLNPLR